MVPILMMRDRFDTFSSLLRLVLPMIIGIFPMAGRNAEPGPSIRGATLDPPLCCALYVRLLLAFPMTVGIFPKAGLFAEPGLTIQGATQVLRRGTVLPLERWFVNSVMACVR